MLRIKIIIKECYSKCYVTNNNVRMSIRNELCLLTVQRLQNFLTIIHPSSDTLGGSMIVLKSLMYIPSFGSMDWLRASSTR